MNIIELSSMPYPEYTPYAMERWEKEGKPSYEYHGNMSFEWPDMELPRETPFLTDHNNEPEDTGIKAADISILQQAQLPPDHEFALEMADYFGLRYNYVALNELKTGRMMGTHVDRHRKLVFKHIPREAAEKIHMDEKKRYVVFKEDQQIGQMFQVGEEFITNWKAGDIFSFAWYVPHATANASNYDRHLVSVVGY